MSNTMSRTNAHDSTGRAATADGFTYGGEHFSRVTVAVVTGVARSTGADPLELPPLYDTLDPDALNTLFDGARKRGESDRLRVTFDYEGCEVTITGDGTVSIRVGGEDAA